MLFKICETLREMDELLFVSSNLARGTSSFGRAMNMVFQYSQTARKRCASGAILLGKDHLHDLGFGEIT